MIAEGLQKLIDVSRESLDASKAAHFPKIDKLPTNQIVKILRDGSHEFLELDPPERKHLLRSVDQIPAFVTYASERLKGSPSVWLNGDGVTVVVTDQRDQWRMDTGRVNLKFSPQFAILNQWEHNPLDHEHKDFLKMLQRYFGQNEAISNLPALLKTLRKLQFNNGVAIVSAADNKKQSVGREIASSVSSGDATELPEMLTVAVKVFDDNAIEQQVAIPAMLDITSTGQFRLIPLAGTIKQAIDVTLAAVHDMFMSNLPDGVPVFFGTP